MKALRLSVSKSLKTPESWKISFIIILVEKEESSVDERLSKIDRLLESRFSRTTPAIDYQAMSLTECKAQLEDIESRLAILDENPDRKGYKSLMKIIYADRF